MARNFVGTLRRNSAEVQALELRNAEDFLRLLRATQTALRGRIEAAASSERTVDASLLRQMLGETQAAIEELERRADGLFGTAQQDAADLANGHIVEEVARLSRAFEDQAIKIDIRDYEVLRDPPQRLLADHFETSVNRYGLELLNGVRRELIFGMRNGATAGDMTRTISGMHGPMGGVGKSNAERLVRTEVSQAYGAAHHKSLQEAKKQVSGLKDVWLHVGSYLCKACGPIHGTERPDSGYWTITLRRKQRRVLHNPAHPNCACRVSAMRPSWRKGLEAAGYLEEQPDANEPGRAAL